MPDRYAVFGNPIAHSQSPRLHAAFAAQTGEDMVYEARLAPRDAFAAALAAFIAEGGRGANVTVPFKEEAFRLCDQLSRRARLAGAVNTLSFTPEGIVGDNTDGVGLVRDIEDHLGFALAGRRILLLGAGGAARGVLAPILERQPASLVIANRTPERAARLAAEIGAACGGPLAACTFADLAGQAPFDVLINATSASLAGASLPLPAGLCAPGSLAYDMVYGQGETPFLGAARKAGATHCADGLGMLIEQAAEAFRIWRGVRPDTAALHAGRPA